MEMNTRVQVEHCITEMISRVDIVRQQILVASGEKLQYKQKILTYKVTQLNVELTQKILKRTLCLVQELSKDTFNQEDLVFV